MTINDQIRDEKLQYDINREAAKISALSSGKIHKFEYLTGEEILPSDQQQIIEQAKFTYSPLGKTFEKQIKTIEDQGEKQIKAIQDQGQLRTIKKYELVDERCEKITDLDKKVNSDNLIYKYKGNTADVKFDEFDNALNIINKIQNGEISLADVKNNQEKFKSYLGEIKKGNKKHRSKEQKNTLYNIEMLYKARNEAIKFYDDYSLMMSEAKTKATKGTGLKILTPKQMLQRLPIALAQVKAGNKLAKTLLNEIRQINPSLKMGTIFMNSQNSKTSDPHVLILKLTDKLDLTRGEKIIALSNLSIYYTWKNIKSSYNNNKFKISAPTWNDKFELPDGSNSVANI